MRLPGPDDRLLEDLRHEQDEHTALRLVWLMFAGWWLSIICLAAAWLCILLGATRPAGLRLAANLSWIINLKPPDDESYDVVMDTLGRVEDNDLAQQSFTLRLLYFITFGWWFSLGWAVVAWFRGISSHQQPESVRMFMHLPAVMTLYRY